MFEFLKILIMTSNFFSLVLNTAQIPDKKKYKLYMFAGLDISIVLSPRGK